MAKFLYKTKDMAGRVSVGELEAGSRQSAADALKKEGIFIVSLKEEKETKSWFPLGGIFHRIPLKEKVFFVQQLAIMIRSGFPMVKALKTIQAQSPNKEIKNVLDDVIEEVEGGIPLSQALTKHTNLLPPIYIKVIASGEKSGKLDRVLERLARDLEANYDLIAKIRGALYYPIFITVALIGVVILVLVTVIPQLESLFKDVQVSLPITTRILLAVSKFFQHYWWLVLILILLLIVLIPLWARTKNGREVFDRVKIKIPVYGFIQRKIYLTRFIRTMRILLASGIPVLEVFRTLEEVVNNVLYQREIRAAAQKIENGYSIARAMTGSKQFPPYIIELIAVGEESGDLDYVLGNLGRFLEKDVKNTTKSMTALIEPILIVIIGAGVGFVVASVIMPIYGLVQVIK